jgi:hypothetical protein
MNFKTREQFEALTRDGMFVELSRVSSALSKGKSRAKKEELIKLYEQARSESTAADTVPPSDADVPPLPELNLAGVQTGRLQSKEPNLSNTPKPDYAFSDDVKEAMKPQPVPVIMEDEVTGEVKSFSSPREAMAAVIAARGESATADLRRPGTGGVYGTIEDGPELEVPNVGQSPLDPPALPGLEGMDEPMVPVNPAMPMLALEDGAVLNLPPRVEERKFIFKDGEDRPLTDKQKYLLTSAEQAFDRFRQNPADKHAKKEFESFAFSLKSTGILLNPKYFEALKQGRDAVRDFRRKARSGVDIEAATEKPARA